ncbi:MAG: formylglycine-generating enzyme family protein [Verrucomicrobia bacterium]|nr:formylglycine-generating enzyme family protein [Verrucomicrobiota bacterium]
MKIWNVVCAGLLLAGTGVFAEEVLVSWESNGVLVATGMEPGSTCTVERASNLSTPFVDVSSEVVGAGGVISTEVSLEQEASFFRVRVDAVIPEGMVKIPGGTNSGTDPDFGTYSLTVSSFYMDRTEVTKAQWDTVYNWAVTNGYSFENAGLGKASNHPVHTVNWYDCVKWCNARSQMEGKTPCYNLATWSCNFNVNGYRLPTTTEWEYAARGGLQSKRFPWGDTINHNYANYRANGLDPYDTSSYTSFVFHPSYASGEYPYTSPVGSFSSNGYGLYDMSGNVWEWYSNGDIRGGGWCDGAVYARCGFEIWYGPANVGNGIGFRAVCR